MGNLNTLLAIQENNKIYGTLVENDRFSIGIIKQIQDRFYYDSVQYSTNFEKEQRLFYQESINLNINAFGGVEIFNENISEYANQIKKRIILNLVTNEIIFIDHNEKRVNIISEQGVVYDEDYKVFSFEANYNSDSSQRSYGNEQREYDREPSANDNSGYINKSVDRGTKTDLKENVGDSGRDSRADFDYEYSPNSTNSTNGEGQTKNNFEQVFDREFRELEFRARIDYLLGSDLANKIISDFISDFNGTRDTNSTTEYSRSDKTKAGADNRDIARFGLNTDDNKREWRGANGTRGEFEQSDRELGKQHSTDRAETGEHRRRYTSNARKLDAEQEQSKNNSQQSRDSENGNNGQDDTNGFAYLSNTTNNNLFSDEIQGEESDNQDYRTEDYTNNTDISQFYNTAEDEQADGAGYQNRGNGAIEEKSEVQIAKAMEQPNLEPKQNNDFKTFLPYQFLTKYEAESYRGGFDFGLTKKERIEANYKAIKLTQTILNDTSRQQPLATQDEQKVLARFSGYGGLKELFLEDKFKEQRDELKELVGEENYKRLAESTENAFFTPDGLIRQMYDGLMLLGVNKKENIYAFEPSCGIGKFISLAPDNFEFEAVEKDKISATIAKLLHPNVKIYNSGLEYVNIYKEYDVVIGNPPFGKETIIDYKSRGNKQSIHNYFAIKASELVKDGGIVNFVTSSYFLDSQTNTHRAIMGESGSFISAFRLPNSIFQHTDVLTDVFYYAKTSDNMPNIMLYSFDTIRHFSDSEPILLNNYYDYNHLNLIGLLSVRTNQFGKKVLTISENTNSSWQDDLADRLKSEHLGKTDIFKINEPKATPITEIPFSQMNSEQINYIGSLSSGNLFEFDSKFYVKDDDNICHEAYFEDELSIDQLDLVAKNDILEIKKRNFIFKNYLNNAEFGICKKVVAFRDTLKEVLNDEKIKPNDEASNNEILSKKNKLINLRNEILKDTKAKFLNSNTKHKKDHNGKITMHNLSSIIELDSIDSYKIYATENELKDKNGKKTYKIGDILLKRVLFAKETTLANNPVEALAKSINEYGKFKIGAMKDYLPSVGLDEILADLTQKRLIFKSLDNNGYELASEFLSGNVKLKHAKIMDMIEKKIKFDSVSLSLEEVAAELENYFPERVKYQDLEVNFGSNYIDIGIYEDFIKNTFFYEPESIVVSLNYFNGTYILNDFELLNGDRTTSNDLNDNAINIIVRNEAGQIKFDTRKMLELVINNQSLEVKRFEKQLDGSTKTIIEVGPTREAMNNAEIIRDLFESYCFNNEFARDSIEESYNKKINVFANKSFNFDDYLHFDNLNKDITLRPHQKNVVYKGIMKNSLLLDHQVGAGKTLASIVLAMEQKRMGIINKALILVPNHLTRQWADEFLRAYPGANILVGDKINSKKARKEFLYKARFGEFDAIIMKHSTFENMNVMQSYQTEVITKEIDNLTKMLNNKFGNRTTPKEESKFDIHLDNQIRKLSKKLEKKAKGKRFDEEIAFEDLGIDALFVDEAHTFKNLYISTNLQGIKGLPLTDSDRAMKMLCATRYCLENNYKLYFMTGTPVSNSISEFYIMQNYLQPKLLEELGLSFFDDWQKAFTKIILNEELDSTGINYKIVPRLSKFINVPELMNIYKQNADIVSNEDIEKKIGRFVPNIKGGSPTNIIIPRSNEVANFIGVEDENGNYNIGSIIYKMDHLDSRSRSENILSLTTEARKAALDYRLINPQSPKAEVCKISELVKRAMYHYNDEAYPKGTQLIFCDMGVSKQNSQKINTDDQNTGGYKTVDEIVIELGLDIVYNDDGEQVYVKYAQNQDGSKTNRVVKEYSVEELIEEQGDKFDVYADILKELVKAGVAQSEIAFIGDAKTDIAKQNLFEKMNSGEIRFLIGSTSKMGAGTNVQRLGVAMHELDCPWRPCDLQQRLGRFIRQGNYWFEKDNNFEISVYRYATEQTYDARMFQVNEQKLRPLAQIKKSNFDDGVRVFDSIDAEVANIAEMKSFATGNMFVLEKHHITNFLQTEERLFKNYKNSILTNQKNLKTAQENLKKTRENIKFLQNIVNIKIADDENYSIKAFGIETSKRSKNKDDDTRFKADKEKISMILDNFARGCEGQEIKMLELKGITLTLQIKFSHSLDGPKNEYIEGFLSDKSGNTFAPQNLIFTRQQGSLFVNISYDGVIQRIENTIKNSENIFNARNKTLQELENRVRLYERFLENNNSDRLEDYNRGVILKVLREDFKNIQEIFKIRNEKRKEGIIINDLSSPYVADFIPKYSQFLNKNGKLDPKNIVVEADQESKNEIKLKTQLQEIIEEMSETTTLNSNESQTDIDEKIEPLEIKLIEVNGKTQKEQLEIIMENDKILNSTKRVKNILG